MSHEVRIPAVPPEPGSHSPAGASGPSALHHPGLDGLRGLAILLVLSFHLVHATSARMVGTSRFHDISQVGWMGVDLFFVLSGFLITGILLDTRDAPHYYRSFYARRALRTLPLYYTALAVVLIGQLVTAGRAVGGNFGPHWLLWAQLANVAPLLDTAQWVSALGVGHFWSLSVEEHFYLLWPPLVRRGGVRRLVAIAMSLIAAAALIRYMVGALWGPMPGYFLTPCRMDLLAAGGVLAMAVRAGWTPERLRRLLRPFALAGLAVLIAVCRWRGYGQPFDKAIQLIGFPCIGLIAAALLAEGLRSASPSRLGRLLEHPALRLCGKYSYGWYVWHGLMLPYCARLHAELTRVTGSGWTAFCLYFPLMVAVSGAAAYLSYRFLESPFLKMKARFSFGPEGSSSAPGNMAIKPGRS